MARRPGDRHHGLREHGNRRHCAIRAGAYDFVPKPFDLDALVLSVSRALEHHQLKSEVRRLRAAVGQAGWADDFIGASPPVQELRSMLQRAAVTDATVLITGETGTGKEVVARVLHQHGKRRAGPSSQSIARRCRKRCSRASSSGTCAERLPTRARARSASSGARTSGTLFLDEIGEMPVWSPGEAAAGSRAALGAAGRLEREVPFDSRIVAATNRDLEQAVAGRAISESDLYYRLNVLHVPYPAPRARRRHHAPGSALSGAFREAARSGPVEGISKPAAERLMAYPGPATCASSGTPSSERSRSRDSITSPSTISPKGYGASNRDTSSLRATT